MPGVSDKGLYTLQGFPAGVNNVAPEHDLPRNDDGLPAALREAVNVDLVGPSKKPRLRAGYTQRLEGRFHSPVRIQSETHGKVLVSVCDGDLRAWVARGLVPIGTLRAGVGERPLTYADVHGDLYWSNGQDFRRIRSRDLADLPGWIDCHGSPLVEAVAGGGMPAGTYRVAVTMLDAEGRESGAPGAVEVDLLEGEGLRVHALPFSPEAVQARVYITPPDESELYAAAQVGTGTTQVLLTGQPWADGKALETLWMRPLPPCQILRWWNGRLLGASGNLVVWTEPHHFGLAKRTTYMRMGQRITMLEPIGGGGEGAGLYVADHKNTYWCGGPSPEKWSRVIRNDAPVVPGTSLVVKGSDLGLETQQQVVFWLSEDGTFYAGMPGGEVVPLTEGRLALPAGEEGASLFRSYNGFRQILTTFIASGRNGLAVVDRASATVTRHPG